MKILTPTLSPKNRQLFFCACVLILVLTKFKKFINNHAPVFLPDTPMYMPPIGNRFALVDLFGNSPRPFNVTGLYAALGDPNLIILVQVALSTAAWIYLFYAILMRLNLHTALLFVFIFAMLLLSLSDTVQFWDLLLQSDSIAYSSSIFATTGLLLSANRVQIGKIETLLIMGASISLCLIRPFCLPILLFFIFSESRKRTQFHKTKKNNESMRRITILCLGFLSLIFIWTSQKNMDLAWGTQLAQTPEVRGRTMQQLGVIQMNTFGSRVVDGIVSSSSLRCFENAINSNPRWWGEIAQACPEDTVKFSTKLQKALILEALSNPINFFTSYKSSANSVFANLETNRFLSFSMQAIFGAKAGPDVIFGANWNYNSTPTILYHLLLIIFIQIILLLIGIKNFGFGSFTLLLTSLALLIAIYISALFSPSDTTRVSSAIMISFVICVVSSGCTINFKQKTKPQV